MYNDPLLHLLPRHVKTSYQITTSTYSLTPPPPPAFSAGAGGR